MSSFGPAAFTVFNTDNSDKLPDIERDDSGLRRYACTAYFESRSALAAMADLLTKADFKPVLGTLGFNAHIQSGPGTDTLSVMIGRGQVRTATAILVGLTGIAATGRYPYRVTANLSFVILP